MHAFSFRFRGLPRSQHMAEQILLPSPWYGRRYVGEGYRWFTTRIPPAPSSSSSVPSSSPPRTVAPTRSRRMVWSPPASSTRSSFFSFSATLGSGRGSRRHLESPPWMEANAGPSPTAGATGPSASSSSWSTPSSSCRRQEGANRWKDGAATAAPFGSRAGRNAGRNTEMAMEMQEEDPKEMKEERRRSNTTTEKDVLLRGETKNYKEYAFPDEGGRSSRGCHVPYSFPLHRGEKHTLETSETPTMTTPLSPLRQFLSQQKRRAVSKESNPHTPFSMEAEEEERMTRKREAKRTPKCPTDSHRHGHVSGARHSWRSSPSSGTSTGKESMFHHPCRIQGRANPMRKGGRGQRFLPFSYQLPPCVDPVEDRGVGHCPYQSYSVLQCLSSSSCFPQESQKMVFAYNGPSFSSDDSFSSSFPRTPLPPKEGKKEEEEEDGSVAVVEDHFHFYCPWFHGDVVRGSSGRHGGTRRGGTTSSSTTTLPPPFLSANSIPSSSSSSLAFLYRRLWETIYFHMEGWPFHPPPPPPPSSMMVEEGMDDLFSFSSPLGNSSRRAPSRVEVLLWEIQGETHVPPPLWSETSETPKDNEDVGMGGEVGLQGEVDERVMWKCLCLDAEITSRCLSVVVDVAVMAMEQGTSDAQKTAWRALVTPLPRETVSCSAASSSSLSRTTTAETAGRWGSSQDRVHPASEGWSERGWRQDRVEKDEKEVVDRVARAWCTLMEAVERCSTSRMSSGVSSPSVAGASEEGEGKEERVTPTVMCAVPIGDAFFSRTREVRGAKRHHQDPASGTPTAMRIASSSTTTAPFSPESTRVSRSSMKSALSSSLRRQGWLLGIRTSLFREAIKEGNVYEGETTEKHTNTNNDEEKEEEEDHDTTPTTTAQHRKKGECQRGWTAAWLEGGEEEWLYGPIMSSCFHRCPRLAVVIPSPPPPPFFGEVSSSCSMIAGQGAATAIRSVSDSTVWGTEEPRGAAPPLTNGHTHSSPKDEMHSTMRGMHGDTSTATERSAFLHEMPAAEDEEEMDMLLLTPLLREWLLQRVYAAITPSSTTTRYPNIQAGPHGKGMEDSTLPPVEEEEKEGNKRQRREEAGWEEEKSVTGSTWEWGGDTSTSPTGTPEEVNRLREVLGTAAVALLQERIQACRRSAAFATLSSTSCCSFPSPSSQRTAVGHRHPACRTDACGASRCSDAALCFLRDAVVWSMLRIPGFPSSSSFSSFTGGEEGLGEGPSEEERWSRDDHGAVVELVSSPVASSFRSTMTSLASASSSSSPSSTFWIEQERGETAKGEDEKEVDQLLNEMLHRAPPPAESSSSPSSSSLSLFSMLMLDWRPPPPMSRTTSSASPVLASIAARVGAVDRAWDTLHTVLYTAYHTLLLDAFLHGPSLTRQTWKLDPHRADRLANYTRVARVAFLVQPAFLFLVAQHSGSMEHLYWTSTMCAPDISGGWQPWRPAQMFSSFSASTSSSSEAVAAWMSTETRRLYTPLRYAQYHTPWLAMAARHSLLNGLLLMTLMAAEELFYPSRRVSPLLLSRGLSSGGGSSCVAGLERARGEARSLAARRGRSRRSEPRMECETQAEDEGSKTKSNRREERACRFSRSVCLGRRRRGGRGRGVVGSGWSSISWHGLLGPSSSSSSASASCGVAYGVTSHPERVQYLPAFRHVVHGFLNALQELGVEGKAMRLEAVQHFLAGRAAYKAGERDELVLSTASASSSYGMGGEEEGMNERREDTARKRDLTHREDSSLASSFGSRNSFDRYRYTALSFGEEGGEEGGRARKTTSSLRETYATEEAEQAYDAATMSPLDCLLPFGSCVVSAENAARLLPLWMESGAPYAALRQAGGGSSQPQSTTSNTSTSSGNSAAMRGMIKTMRLLRQAARAPMPEIVTTMKWVHKRVRSWDGSGAGGRQSSTSGAPYRRKQIMRVRVPTYRIVFPHTAPAAATSSSSSSSSSSSRAGVSGTPIYSPSSALPLLYAMDEATVIEMVRLGLRMGAAGERLAEGVLRECVDGQLWDVLHTMSPSWMEAAEEGMGGGAALSSSSSFSGFLFLDPSARTSMTTMAPTSSWHGNGEEKGGVGSLPYGEGTETYTSIMTLLRHTDHVTGRSLPYPTARDVMRYVQHPLCFSPSARSSLSWGAWWCSGVSVTHAGHPSLPRPSPSMVHTRTLSGGAVCAYMRLLVHGEGPAAVGTTTTTATAFALSSPRPRHVPLEEERHEGWEGGHHGSRIDEADRGGSASRVWGRRIVPTAALMEVALTELPPPRAHDARSSRADTTATTSARTEPWHPSSSSSSSTLTISPPPRLTLPSLYAGVLIDPGQFLSPDVLFAIQYHHTFADVGSAWSGGGGPSSAVVASTTTTTAGTSHTMTQALAGLFCCLHSLVLHTSSSSSSIVVPTSSGRGSQLGAPAGEVKAKSPRTGTTTTTTMWWPEMERHRTSSFTTPERREPSKEEEAPPLPTLSTAPATPTTTPSRYRTPDVQWEANGSTPILDLLAKDLLQLAHTRLPPSQTSYYYDAHAFYFTASSAVSASRRTSDGGGVLWDDTVLPHCRAWLSRPKPSSSSSSLSRGGILSPTTTTTSPQGETGRERKDSAPAEEVHRVSMRTGGGTVMEKTKAWLQQQHVGEEEGGEVEGRRGGRRSRMDWTCVGRSPSTTTIASSMASHRAGARLAGRAAGMRHQRSSRGRGYTSLWLSHTAGGGGGDGVASLAQGRASQNETSLISLFSSGSYDTTTSKGSAIAEEETTDPSRGRGRREAKEGPPSCGRGRTLSPSLQYATVVRMTLATQQVTLEEDGDEDEADVATALEREGVGKFIHPVVPTRAAQLQDWQACARPFSSSTRTTTQTAAAFSPFSRSSLVVPTWEEWSMCAATFMGLPPPPPPCSRRAGGIISSSSSSSSLERTSGGGTALLPPLYRTLSPYLWRWMVLLAWHMGAWNEGPMKGRGPWRGRRERQHELEKEERHRSTMVKQKEPEACATVKHHHRHLSSSSFCFFPFSRRLSTCPLQLWLETTIRVLLLSRVLSSASSGSSSSSSSSLSGGIGGISSSFTPVLYHFPRFIGLQLRLWHTLHVADVHSNDDAIPPIWRRACAAYAGYLMKGSYPFFPSSSVGSVSSVECAITEEEEEEVVGRVVYGHLKRIMGKWDREGERWERAGGRPLYPRFLRRHGTPLDRDDNGDEDGGGEDRSNTSRGTSEEGPATKASPALKRSDPFPSPFSLLPDAAGGVPLGKKRVKNEVEEEGEDAVVWALTFHSFFIPVGEVVPPFSGRMTPTGATATPSWMKRTPEEGEEEKKKMERSTTKETNEAWRSRLARTIATTSSSGEVASGKTESACWDPSSTSALASSSSFPLPLLGALWLLHTVLSPSEEYLHWLSTHLPRRKHSRLNSNVSSPFGNPFSRTRGRGDVPPFTSTTTTSRKQAYEKEKDGEDSALHRQNKAIFCAELYKAWISEIRQG